MKKLLLSLLILSCVLGMQSCSEDFEVAAPYRPITVVYGMLNIKDTAHYIRIQKSFLDENKNAIDMAKVSDSSFYKPGDIDVLIKEFNNGTLVGQPIVLQRVNMADENYPKNSGVFFTDPSYAYKFTNPLVRSHTYRLLINNKVTGINDSAEINIVDSSYLLARSVNYDPHVTYTINFAAPGSSVTPNKFQVFIEPAPSGAPGAIQYMEGILRFHWVDSNLSTGAQRDTMADFFFDSAEGSDLILQVENASFYTFFRQVMKEAPEGHVRLIDTGEMIVYGSGKEFSDYAKTIQLQNAGFTADQIKPFYTNIKGKDVFGLFTSRTFRVKENVVVSDVTMDSLKNSVLAKGLGIRGRSHH